MPKHDLRRLMLCVTLLLACTAAAALPARAGDDEGGYPGAFLRYGVSVRSLGMGRVFVALEDCPGLMYDNPASLMRSRAEWGLYGMHFEPGYFEGFNFLSVSHVGNYQGESPLGKFLFGPSAAWGAAIVHVSTDGIGARDEEDMPLGEEFGFYEQALLIGFSREAVGPQGVLDYGLTFKVPKQGFTGGLFDRSDWGFGLDLGAQVQMINPWLVKKLAPIKYLLPMRLGVVVQNLVNPRFTLDDTEETLPTVLRLGMAYGFDNVFGPDTRLLVAGDLDWMFDDAEGLLSWERCGSRGVGRYVGVEPQWTTGPWQLTLPRLGFNNEGEGSTLTSGFGVGYKFPWADLRVDYAHKFISEIGDNDHIALTFSPGIIRDLAYFRKSPCGLSDQERQLQVLSIARKGDDGVAAARKLGNELDVANQDRYLEFAGDADYLFARFLTALADNRIQEAIGLAGDLDGKYSAKGAAAASPEQRLNHAEVLLVLARASSDARDAAGYLTEARDLLSVGPSEANELRRLYQYGVACWLHNEPDRALQAFEGALKAPGEDDRNYSAMAMYGKAQCLEAQGRCSEAVTCLETAFGELPNAFAATLPRYHLAPAEAGPCRPLSDAELGDDVLLALSACYEKLGNTALSKQALAAVLRFYPSSDRAEDARAKLRALGDLRS